MSHNTLKAAVAALLGILLVSCGSDGATTPLTEPALSRQVLPGTAAQLPGLPDDSLQPWEALDGSGHVTPVSDRTASSINGNTDFTPGVERFLDAGDVASNAEALRLNGTDDSGSSYAMYRVSLQDAQPGVVSIDANLLASGSEYFVGVSNYGGSRWQWSGPFSDSHLRLPVVTDGNGNFTSELGNTFVTVLVDSGSSLDIVGVGVNQFDLVDLTAPATPAGLSLTSVNGGIELTWSPVLENDLAGYSIHYSDRSFINPDSVGVRSVPYLEGSTRHLLSGQSRKTYVRISAVDLSGNRSAPSELLSAIPLEGDAAEIELTTDSVSTSVNGSINLSASGADSYDWDLDGDGVFEVAGDAAGSQSADTSATGIIRPRVRATDTEGTAVALGGLSLIITGNTRPGSSAVADPQSGSTPLSVTFSGFAEDLEDGEALTYAWDFDGDGFYEADTDTTSPDPYSFLSPGIFNTRFYVEDSEGAWSVASLTIIADGEDLSVPNAEIVALPYFGNKGETILLDASNSRAAMGESITQYVWDLDDDGFFETNGDLDPDLQTSFATAGEHDVHVRVTDSSASQAFGTITIVIHGWSDPITLLDGVLGAFAPMQMIQIDGRPAIYMTITRGSIEHRFALADDAKGKSWQDTLLISDQLGAGFTADIALVNGKPAIPGYLSSPDDLAFVRANDALGQSWPVHQVVESDGDVGLLSELAVIAGRPAIAYFVDDVFDLFYVRSEDENGDSWGTPVEVESTGDVGAASSMIVVNGRPAIAYEDFGLDNLMYVRANDSTGSSWGTPVIVDTEGQFVDFISMLIVNGYPAIGSDAGTSESSYSRALDENGETWGVPTRLDIGPGNTSMLFIDGRPAICSNGSGVDFIQSIDINGDNWGSAEKVHAIGQRPGIINADGMPGIAFYDFDLDLVQYTRKY